MTANPESQSATVDMAVDQEALLRGIADASLALLDIELNYAGAMNRCLGAVGSALKVDRAYVFEAHTDADGTPCVSQRFEWSRESIEPQIDNPELQEVPFSALGPWEANLRAGQHMAFVVAGYPYDEIRELLEAQDIISILVLPIILHGELWGFIGFDDCTRPRRWRDAELAALSALGGATGAAIVRSRVHETVLEISAPLLQVWEGVIAVPLVGRLTPDRANRLIESVLGAIHGRGARDVLLDITGMSAIDPGELDMVLRTFRAARMLGARCALVGTSAVVAQAIVNADMDLASLTTHASLESGLAQILARRGLEVRRHA